MKKDRNKYIIKRFTIDLKTRAEISRELKISSTRVMQILSSLLKYEQIEKIKVIRSAVKILEAKKRREKRYKEDKPYRDKIIKRAKLRYNKLKRKL